MRGKLAAAMLVALLSMACGGPTDPSKNQVEPFTGSVQPNSFGDVHKFTIASGGEIDIKVTNVSPGNVFLGLGYGQFTGGSCGLMQQTTVGNTGINRTAISGQVVLKGDYCVIVFDPAGSLGIAPFPVAQNYTLTVSHP